MLKCSWLWVKKCKRISLLYYSNYISLKFMQESFRFLSPVEELERWAGAKPLVISLKPRYFQHHLVHKMQNKKNIAYFAGYNRKKYCVHHSKRWEKDKSTEAQWVNRSCSLKSQSCYYMVQIRLVKSENHLKNWFISTKY